MEKRHSAIKARRHPAGSRGGRRAPAEPPLDVPSAPACLRYPTVRPGRSARAGGFTLVELMVVVGLIVLLIAIAVPAIGPLTASNQQAQAVSTLAGLITTAQTAAQANITPVAVRVEPAFRTDRRGLMEDALGQPADGSGAFDPLRAPRLLGHQQLQLLLFASRRVDQATDSVDMNPAFSRMPEASPVALPKGMWLAPDYALRWDGQGGRRSMAEEDLRIDHNERADPSADWENPGAAFNLMDTFYIVFDQSGASTRFPAEKLWYYDESQRQAAGSGPPRPLLLWHPDDAARGVLVYDRQRFNAYAPTDAAGRWTFLATNARPVYVNRSLGSLIQGAPGLGR